MPELQLCNPRNRRDAEQAPPQEDKTPLHIAKRQKRSHASEYILLPAFWDNLSKIDLTRGALKELDRRNNQAALTSQPPSRRPQRRITRRALGELQKSFQPLKPPAEYLCCCGTSGLRDIRQTAKHGGPDLSDIRGLPEPSNPLNPAMSSTGSSSRAAKRISELSSSTKPSTKPTKTVSTGPYNRNFQQNLIDGGVYPYAYRHPDGRVPAKPKNWEEINRRLSRPRPSLSPSRFSEEAHEKFKQADADAVKEKQVSTSVIPVIEGDIGDARCVSGGIPFTKLDPLTDGTLVPGNPDIYYGARPEQLDRRVRDELGGHIIPSTQHDLPAAPNFFVAAKGPDGSPAVAARQASYDGALGARGMLSLASYGHEDPVFDKAFTISSTYCSGMLKMFTIHSSQRTGSGSRLEYPMHQLGAFAMIGTAEAFRQGATYFRNGRDWAKEQRDEAIRVANCRVAEDHARTATANANATTATNADVTPASTSTGEGTFDGSQSTEVLTGESQPTRDEGSNTTSQTSGPSSAEPSADRRAPGKRSSEPLEEEPPPRRQKRHNAGDSDSDISAASNSDENASSSDSDISAASNKDKA